MKAWALIALIPFLILPQASAVVISEVFYDPAGPDNNYEFVELYNPTAQTVSLVGWKLERGNGDNANDWKDQVTLNATIPAYGFYLIGDLNVSGADVTKDLDIQNGPDAVRLLDTFSSVQDLVGYGNGTFNETGYFEGAPVPGVAAGHSIERKPGYLDPLAGNGQDSNDNSEDFLDRTTPEAQNSSFHEIPFPTVARALSGTGVYQPNVSVTVTLTYAGFSSLVGLIVREYNAFGVLNASPLADVNEPGLAKWLFTGSIPDGQITYSFFTPMQTGSYTIRGDWEGTDANGTFSEGNSTDTLFTVSGGLSGVVEDIFGMRLASSIVTGGGANTTTDSTGFYLLLPSGGMQNISASLTGYVSTSTTINTSSTFSLNFTNSLALTPTQLNDTRMLDAVVRWANNYLDDRKLLEVVHRWALS